jgi:hypothetical protein
MRRGVWTRRWLATAGGVLVNGLILGALVLIEEPAPLLEEPPVIVLELEKPQKRAAPQRQASAGGRSATAAAAVTPAPATSSEGEGTPTVTAPAAPPAPAVDPGWKIDPKVVDRWRLLEGGLGTGRAKRACLGQTSEHMTPEEKEACYDAWGKKPDKRPSPTFIGPIDERKWEEYEFSGPPRRPTADEDKRRRRDLCRAVGRVLKANPSGPPLVRQGACP